MGVSAAPIEAASTAVRPKSDANTAAALSVVLRHEQDFDFDVVWCIGQTCPSPWEHVHSTLPTVLGLWAQRTVGVRDRTQSWYTSQPPAKRESRRRNTSIETAAYHVDERARYSRLAPLWLNLAGRLPARVVRSKP